MEREELKYDVQPGAAEISKRSWRKVSIHDKTIAAFGRRDKMEPGEYKSAMAHAALYAEAHNVANEHGMWPLDLVARINELEDELNEIREQGKDLHM